MQPVFPNAGIRNLRKILKRYHFVQDAMIVQCVPTFATGVQRPQHAMPFRNNFFNPEIEEDILEELSYA